MSTPSSGNRSTGSSIEPANPPAMRVRVAGFASPDRAAASIQYHAIIDRTVVYRHVYAAVRRSIREAAPGYGAAQARGVALRILADRFGDDPAVATRSAGGGAGTDGTVGASTTPRAAGAVDRRGTVGPGGTGSPGGTVGTGRTADRSFFDLAAFQEEAVRRAERILAARNGVVIADSVGLGKTFVALALVERTLRRGGRILVTAPAALRKEWTGPLGRLARGLGIHETSGFRGAGPPVDGAKVPGPRPRIAWISHQRLSRGGYSEELLTGSELVVVDEAHAFRTPGTRRYRALAALCRGARVVLLTATPVNNSVWDLYFQLRLFAGDAAFRDLGIPDLREAFRSAAGAGTDGGAPRSLLPVIQSVMIRRTRPYLRDRYDGIRIPGRGKARVVTFSRRAPPHPVRYALQGTVGAAEGEDPGPGEGNTLLDVLESLTLAPFRLPSYGARSIGPDASGAAELIRIALLKRLESSLAAFRASIRRQLQLHVAFLSALERGRLLRAREHQTLYLAGRNDDTVQLVLEDLVLEPVPAGLDVDRLRGDAERDLRRLRRLLTAVAEPLVDAKRARLIELLDHELRSEKVVIFTEFRETARDLWRALVERGGVGLVDGAGAFLGRSPSGRRAVIERFAPHANRVRPPPARERVDLLIATDVLSEGLNLQDAGVVVSYDLPWNPVRLIQRVGRVDRLGSPHAVVRTFHFLPDRGLDQWLGLLDRLRSKLGAIARTVGAEGEVLHGAAEAAGGVAALVDGLAAGDPDVLDSIERRDAAPFELEERLRDAYLRATPSGDTGHVASWTAPSPLVPHRFLLAYRVGEQAVWIVAELDDGDPATIASVREDEITAAEILLSVLEDDEARTTGPEAPPPQERVDEVTRAATAVLADRIARSAAPAGVPRGIAGRASRRLLDALAAVPGGPDEALCRRADALLAALAAGCPIGAEDAIRAVIAGRQARRPEDALTEPGERLPAAEELVADLEQAIHATRVDRATAVAGTAGRTSSGWLPTVTLVGILELRPGPAQ